MNGHPRKVRSCQAVSSTWTSGLGWPCSCGSARPGHPLGIGCVLPQVLAVWGRHGPGSGPVWVGEGQHL